MTDDDTLRSTIERLAIYGEAPALIAVGDDALQNWSFTRTARESLDLAAGLLAAGLEKGERVAFFAPASPEWAIACLAVIAAGAVPVPLDVLLEGDDLAFVLEDSGARRIFTTLALGGALDARDTTVEIARLFLDGDGLSAGAPRPGGELPPLSPDDIACMFYTSGTTGRPKGVPLSHANLMANLSGLLPEGLVGPGDRVLMPLPLHHVYPFMVGLMTPLAAGAAVVFPKGPSGPEIVQGLRLGRATTLLGVPRLYTALVAAIEERIKARGRAIASVLRCLIAVSAWLNLRAGCRVGRILFRRIRATIAPELSLMTSGGAKLEPEIWWTLEGLGWQVLTGYGLTETSPILTFNARGRARAETAGQALNGVSLRIDAAGPDGAGEIQAKGAGVFAGYWKRPDETALAFTPDGWFRTGDLGYLDSDAYLHILGRAKELIVLAGGTNIQPEEVEAAYQASPVVHEAAVLERQGNLVALVVPDLDAMRVHGTGRIEDLLRDQLRNRSLELPSPQRITGHAVMRVPLPRTTLGKLRRHLLPDLYEKALAGAAPKPAAEWSDADRALIQQSPAGEIWQWLEGRFPDQPLSLDISPQLDLGVDSLAWIGFALEIEDRFAISLTEEQVARIVSLRDLLREAAEAVAQPSPPTDPARGGEGRLVALLSPVLHTLGWTIYSFVRILVRILFRISVEGLDKLPPIGAFVIAPNHASYLDPVVLATVLGWPRARRSYFAGWTGLMFKGPLSRMFSRATHVVPIDPDRAAGESMRLARAVLDAGNIMVWYPEGRRTLTGALQPFFTGIGAVLAETGVPAVPVYVKGTFGAAPIKRKIPKPGRIRVVFGAPQDPAALAARGAGETEPARIVDALHDSVAALEPDAHRPR